MFDSSMTSSSHLFSVCSLLPPSRFPSLPSLPSLQACADKLARELQLFGFPPQFPSVADSLQADVATMAIDDAPPAGSASDGPSPASASAGAAAEKDPTQFKGKKVLLRAVQGQEGTRESSSRARRYS